MATVLLETGILPMTEPETRLTLEAPGGLVEVRAHCRNGKAERVYIQNVASFADRLGVPLEVPGIGTLTVDTAFGGDSFVIASAAELGLAVAPGEARELVEAGIRITAAANQQIGFTHPEIPDWRHISFCQIHEPLQEKDGIKTVKNTCVIRPGKLDRSPTGTGVSARMAVLHARGEMRVGDRLTAYSVIDSCFEGRIVAETRVGGRLAIIPEISGRAWITGRTELSLDTGDPWPRGYRVADTWPKPPVA